MNTAEPRKSESAGDSRAGEAGPGRTRTHPAEDRTVLVPSDPLDCYTTGAASPRSWKVIYVRMQVSMIARLRNSLRKTHAGGRPARPTPCPRCGAACPAARVAREHCRVGRGGPEKKRAASPLRCDVTIGTSPRNRKVKTARVRVSAIARAMNSLRKNPAGGRPAKPTPCPRCGAACPSACAAREHCRAGCGEPEKEGAEGPQRFGSQKL